MIEEAATVVVLVGGDGTLVVVLTDVPTAFEPAAVLLPLALLQAPTSMETAVTAKLRLTNKLFDTTRTPDPPEAMKLEHG